VNFTSIYKLEIVQVHILCPSKNVTFTIYVGKKDFRVLIVTKD